MLSIKKCQVLTNMNAIPGYRTGSLFVCFVGLFHIGNWNFWLVMA